MSATHEFSRLVPLARVGTEPHQQQISANPAERAALARRFDLVALDRLDAVVELHRRDGRLVLLHGEFEAAFEQSCIVTLDPIAGAVAERFSLVYGPPDEEEAAAGLVGDEVAFEPLDGDIIDIGEAVAQEFSLALPAFPRSPDASLETDDAPGASPGPFAGLAPLRDRDDSDLC